MCDDDVSPALFPLFSRFPLPGRSPPLLEVSDDSFNIRVSRISPAWDLGLDFCFLSSVFLIFSVSYQSPNIARLAAKDMFSSRFPRLDFFRVSPCVFFSFREIFHWLSSSPSHFSNSAVKRGLPKKKKKRALPAGDKQNTKIRNMAGQSAHKTPKIIISYSEPCWSCYGLDLLMRKNFKWRISLKKIIYINKNIILWRKLAKHFKNN